MNKKTIIAGDVLAIAILTVIGFAAHGETGISFIPRMGTTFFPVLIGWLLVAPWFGVFDAKVLADPKLSWRALLAMLLAAPLAAILRAALLGEAALPLFTLILGFSFGMGMLFWRAIYALILKRGAK